MRGGWSDSNAGAVATKPQVVMSIHYPVSAKRFIAPMVRQLNSEGIASALWVQDYPEHRRFTDAVDVPAQLVACDLPLNPLAFVKRVRDFRCSLRAAAPRVLHAHQTRCSLIPMLAARIERVPIRVYHNHGLPYLGYRGAARRLLRSLERLNVRLATHVLLVSHSNLAAAQDDGLLPAGKGKVLGEGSAVGVNLNEFSAEWDTVRCREARERVGAGSAPFVLGFVGRPVARKGFHALLHAWEQAELWRKGDVLLLAGCSQADVQAAVGRTVPGIRPLGYLLEMADFYRACDCVALPSAHEGFPMSMLEAAAAGRPAIATDIPGIRCAVKHDETGLLVPWGDERSLGSAIKRLARNRSLCKILGMNGRRRAERCFSQERVLAELSQYYRNELGIVPLSEAPERRVRRAA